MAASTRGESHKSYLKAVRRTDAPPGEQRIVSLKKSVGSVAMLELEVGVHASVVRVRRHRPVGPIDGLSLATVRACITLRTICITLRTVRVVRYDHRVMRLGHRGRGNRSRDTDSGQSRQKRFGFQIHFKLLIQIRMVAAATGRQLVRVGQLARFRNVNEMQLKYMAFMKTIYARFREWMIRLTDEKYCHGAVAYNEND